MHTTVETVHMDDVQNVIRLMYETLLALKGGKIFGISSKREVLYRAAGANFKPFGE